MPRATPSEPRSHAPRTATRRGGWTLVELIVVLIVISILAATIVPQFAGSLSEAGLRAGARELVGLLTLAGSESVARGAVHRVRWASTEDSAILERLEGTGAARAFQPCRDLPRHNAALDPRFTVEMTRALDAPGSASPGSADDAFTGFSRGADSQAIEFHPDGTSDGGRVTLRGRFGAGLVLIVHPTTARVTLQAATPETGP